MCKLEKMRPMKAPTENKPSMLLTPEENQLIARMLGVRCQTMATSIVQLFITQGPNHSQWIKKDTGVLCFVKDNIRKNYFFRIFCFKRNQIVWEHEMYNNMDYTATMPYLHTFEGEDYMVGFNFAEVNEARDMKNVVDSKIMAKRRKEERKAKNSISLEEPKMRVVNSDVPLIPKYTDAATKKAKRKRNITKADIGNPSAFRHISHVGWDPNRGFDVNTEDAQFADFFKKAGVSETELRDTETRKFIYDFIAAKGVREVIATEQKQQATTRRPPPAIPTSTPATGPPVPPRLSTRGSHSRVAPPPPPSSNAPTRPPPTTPRSTSQVNLNEDITREYITHGRVSPEISLSYKECQASNHALPPPPAGNAPPPPPPPPLPALDIPMSPPPLPSLDESLNNASVGPAPPDMRTALMDSIRSGTTLKPVEEKKPAVEDPRGDLLSEIRRGFQLKPCQEREVKPPASPHDTASDLAGALARALAERNRFIHSEDDSTSDTESDNEDEWDA